MKRYKTTAIIIFLWVLTFSLVIRSWDDITYIYRFNNKQNLELRELQIQKLKLEIEILQHELNNKQP